MSNIETSLEHQDALADRMQNFLETSAKVASVALAIGAMSDAGVAEAAISHKSRVGHVQEFVQVHTSDAGGPVSRPNHTFVFNESCTYRDHVVSRKVIDNKDLQPLGQCDIGSKVKVIDEKPLSSVWKNIQTTKTLKAKRHNGRFIFEEVKQDDAVLPSSTGPASMPQETMPLTTPTPEQSPATTTTATAPTTQPTTTTSSTNTTPTPPPSNPSSSPYGSDEIGYDVSYPNCGNTYEAPDDTEYGIFGVNGGLVFSYNSCLAQEVAEVPQDQVSLYANTGYNKDSTHIDPTTPKDCTVYSKDSVDYRHCIPYNYGYAAGEDAFNQAAKLGATSLQWWLDIEPPGVNTWSGYDEDDDVIEDQQSLLGEEEALKNRGVSFVGVYSTTDTWNKLTGSWQNKWPAWGATSEANAGDAKKYCARTAFTGATTFTLIQYTPSSTQDLDISCKTT